MYSVKVFDVGPCLKILYMFLMTHMHVVPLMGNFGNVFGIYRTWENFGGGKFGRTVGNSPKFSPPIFINARVFNKLPTDLPNFSSPKTLEPLICQNFPPPKFSLVWYADLSLHYSACQQLLLVRKVCQKYGMWKLLHM